MYSPGESSWRRQLRLHLAARRGAAWPASAAARVGLRPTPTLAAAPAAPTVAVGLGATWRHRCTAWQGGRAGGGAGWLPVRPLLSPNPAAALRRMAAAVAEPAGAAPQRIALRSTHCLGRLVSWGRASRRLAGPRQAARAGRVGRAAHTSRRGAPWDPGWTNAPRRGGPPPRPVNRVGSGSQGAQSGSPAKRL